MTLNWEATKVDTCSGGNGLSGAVPLSGSRVLNNILIDTTYSLTCVGRGGQVENSVMVRVGTSTATATGATLTVIDITPAKTTSSVTTNTNTGSMISLTDENRRAQIQEILKQILKLIGELQNQLAIMKATGAR